MLNCLTIFVQNRRGTMGKLAVEIDKEQAEKYHTNFINLDAYTFFGSY